jgi:hypothetical protein
MQIKSFAAVLLTLFCQAYVDCHFITVVNYHVLIATCVILLDYNWHIRKKNTNLLFKQHNLIKRWYAHGQ